MPVTRQQIQTEEARTGIKQIAMRREYNAQQMKSSEEVFVEAGGIVPPPPALKFYDVSKKKKVLVSKYELEAIDTKNGKRYRAKSGKLSRFVSKDFYYNHTTMRQRGRDPFFNKGDIVRHKTTGVKYQVKWVNEVRSSPEPYGTLYLYYCYKKGSESIQIPERKLELVKPGSYSLSLWSKKK